MCRLNAQFALGQNVPDSFTSHIVGLLLVCAVCEISILGFNPCIPITPYRVLWQTVKT